MTTSTAPAAGLADGERRRNQGIALAAERRQWLVWRCQLALLDAIRSRADLTATTDQATSDLRRQYLDGGRWRGTVPRGLAHLGLIRRAGAVASCRPSRHAGYVTLWRGVDDDAIDAYRDHLRAWLAATPAPGPEQRTDFS